VPLSRWSSAEFARELATRQKVEAISASTVWRIFHTDAIRPWLHRSWILPRDPDFAVKAGRALDLYARKVENPNDFTTLDQISERLAAFEIRYNKRAVRFDWKFGRDDLDKLIARIDLHERAA
jgi:hypothetical protein